MSEGLDPDKSQATIQRIKSITLKFIHSPKFPFCTSRLGGRGACISDPENYKIRSATL